MRERILILNHEFPPLEGGGANASFFIGRALARMGWGVEVVTASLGRLPRAETMDGMRVRRAPGRRRPLGPARMADLIEFAIAGAREALRAAEADPPDASLAFFGVPAGLAGVWLRARLGVPLILSLRGSDVPGNNPETYRLSHALSGPVTRSVWRRADRVTAVSEELRAVALRSAPGLRIDVIPNGVDAERFHPLEPRPARSAGETVRILSVGQTIARKGHAQLIRALPEVIRRTGADLRVLIVGREGPDHAALEALARTEGVGDRVAFRGPAGRDAMPEVYREADLLAHFSVCEGMSNVVLEALASGLPVVATPVGGMSALVEPGVNGALVPVGDAAAAAEALIPLVADRSRREGCAKAARARAEALSWEAAARRFAAIVGEVSAARRAA
jgi:glycosyltransferase involved in cell wall biosynthesis